MHLLQQINVMKQSYIRQDMRCKCYIYICMQSMLERSVFSDSSIRRFVLASMHAALCLCHQTVRLIRLPVLRVPACLAAGCCHLTVAVLQGLGN